MLQIFNGVSFVALVFSFGSLEYLLRKLPGRAPNAQRQVYRTIMLFFGAVTCVVALGGVAALFAYGAENLYLNNRDLILIGLLLVVNLHMVQRVYYLFGCTEYTKARLAQLLYADTWFLPLIICFWLGRLDLPQVLWIWLGWMLLSILITGPWVRLGLVLRAQGEEGAIRPIIRFGLPLVPMVLGDFMLRYQGDYFLEVMKDKIAVANYGFCRNMALMGFVAGSAVLDILSTEFFKLCNQSDKDHLNDLSKDVGLRTMFTAMVRYNVIISLSVGGLLTLLAVPIIRLIASEQFVDTASLMAWTAPYPLLLLQCMVFGRMLMAVDRTFIVGISSVIGAVVALVVAWFLIPSMGERGMAVGTWVGLGFILIVFGWTLRFWRWIEWNQLMPIRLLVFAGVLMGGLVWVQDNQGHLDAIVQLLIGGVWTLFCIAITFIVKKSDLSLVMGSFNKPDDQADES